MSDNKNKPAVVIDNGSWAMKAGFGGEDDVRSVIPCNIGHFRDKEKKDNYIGAEATSKQNLLDLKWPLKQRIVTDWGSIEKLWHHIFYNELKIDPEEHPILQTEPCLNPMANREKMTQICFETFRAPLLYVSIQQVLALYASGRTTGTVVDSGQDITHFVPVDEGFALPHAILRMDLGGRDLNEHLAKLLYQSGAFKCVTDTYYQNTFLSELPYELFQRIEKFSKYSLTSFLRDQTLGLKEKKCYVALDYQAEMKKSDSNSLQEYELPDKQVIKVGNELFQCPEVLFQPSLMGKAPNFEGIHNLTNNCIRKCDVDVRPELFENILLSGGNTLFPGSANRLQKEMVDLVPLVLQTKVKVCPSQVYGTWTGGSILCSLPTFSEMWISKEEYDDSGPSIVHRKCF